MKAEYSRELGRNYLILKPEAEPDLNVTEELPEYMMQMAQRCLIQGLLPVQRRQVNGQVQYWYDITSRQPLSLLVSHQDLRYDALSRLLTGISETVSGVQDYLMDPEGLYFAPDFIYADPDSWQCACCFFPKQEPGSLAVLAEYVLKHLDHTDRACVQLGYGFYALAREKDCNIRQVFERLADGKQAKDVEETDKKKSADSVQPVQSKALREHADPADSLQGGEEPGPAGSVDDLFTPARWDEINGTVSDSTDGNGGGKGAKTGRKKGGAAGHGGSRRGIALWGFLALFTAAAYVGAVWFFRPELSSAGALAAILIGVYMFLYSLTHRRKEDGAARGAGEEADFLAALTDEAYEPWHAEQMEEKADTQADRSAATHPGEKNNTWQESADFIFSSAHKGEENREREDPGEGVTEYMLLSDALKVPEIKALQSTKPAVLRSMSPAKAQNIRLEKRSVTIGKKKGQADVVINHSTISRLHVRVDCDGDTFTLTDLNSTNGTFVNGEQLKPRETRVLQDGDTVLLADIKYIFQSH